VPREAGTGGPARDGAADPEAAYYQAVEEYFVARRGSPLSLSNEDWFLIHRWREAGLPLRVVLRGMRDALDGHAHSWGRRRKVRKLAYCEGEVEAARERWQRALGLGLDGERPLAESLRALAATLEAARGPGARGAAAARSAAAAVRARAAEDLDPAAAEAWLAREERALLEVLREEAGPVRVAAVEAETAAVLEPYRGRMPERVLDRLRGDSTARRLLGLFGLPRLTLFPVA
jgi:hypothetical protein